MFRTILSIGAFQAGGIVVTALRSKLLAVLLGPAGFGVVATIDQFVTSLAQLSNLSVPFTALKFLSSSHSVSEEAFQKSYSAFLRLMLILAVLATVASVAVVLLLLGRLDPELAQHQTTVLIAVLGLPALLLMMFFVNALAARQESLRSVQLTVLYNAVLLVFGGIGCWIGGIRGIYLGAVPAAMLLIGLSGLALRARQMRTGSSGTVAIWAQLKDHPQILHTAVFMYIGVASIACTMLLSRYVAITRLDAASAGLFQACLAIAMAIGSVLVPAISLYLSPQLNRSLPVAEKSAVVGRFLPRLVFLFCLAALPVVLFPELVLRVLFSERFTSAAGLLVWFVGWQFVSQVVTIHHHLLIGLDDMRGYCWAIVAGNVVTVLGCFGAIDQWGMPGLGAAFVVGTLFSLALTLHRLHRRHTLSLAASSLPLLLAAPVALTSMALLPLGPETAFAGLVYRVLLALAFCGALWRLLPRELSHEIASGLRARLARNKRE